MKGIFDYESPLMGALTSIGDCICLSVLWIVFSLPIVTLGASTTALYAVAYHSIRLKKGALWRTFWGAFRENFKRSTLASIVVLAVLALLTVDVFVLRGVRANGGALGGLFYAVLVLWCLALTWAVYAAAYAARFNGRVREVLKLALQLMAIHPVKILGVLLPLTAGLALSLMVPFMALILPGAVFVAVSFTTERIFRLHMRPEDLERVQGEQSRKENTDDQ